MAGTKEPGIVKMSRNLVALVDDLERFGRRRHWLDHVATENEEKVMDKARGKKAAKIAITKLREQLDRTEKLLNGVDVKEDEALLF